MFGVRGLSKKAGTYFRINYVLKLKFPLLFLITTIILVDYMKVNQLVSLFLLAMFIVHFFYKIVWLPERFANSYTYELTEDRLNVNRGVWTQNSISIPMFRVQHVSLRRGIIHRKLGVTTITIHTAGSVYSIPAIDKEVAEELKEVIMQLAKEREEY